MKTHQSWLQAALNTLDNLALGLGSACKQCWQAVDAYGLGLASHLPRHEERNMPEFPLPPGMSWDD